MPRLVSLERQLSVPLAEGLRRLEPAQADVLAPVLPHLGIKSCQFPDAIPHSRAERRCVRMGFAKKRLVLFCASSPHPPRCLVILLYAMRASCLCIAGGGALRREPVGNSQTASRVSSLQ